MKTSSTSCSLLNSLRFSTAITVSKKYYYHYQATQLRNHNCLSPFPSFSSTFPKNYNFHGKCLHVNPFSAFSSSSGHDSQNPPRDLAVLLEVDGYPLLFFHYLIMRHCDKWFLIARIQKHACLLYIMHIIILLFLLTISVLQSFFFPESLWMHIALAIGKPSMQVRADMIILHELHSVGNYIYMFVSLTCDFFFLVLF